MPGKFSRGKLNFPAWGFPVLALSASLLAHAVWLIPPQHHPAPASSPPTIKLYAYPNLDTSVWSPTLFSLPSALGFSGAMRPSTSNVLPPLKSPVRISQLTPVNIEILFPEPVIKEKIQLQTLLPITVPPTGFAADSVPEIYAWRLEVLDAPDIRLELNRLPGVPPFQGGVVLTGTMTFDPGGQVQSLLLDPPVMYPDLRPQIIRSLRRVRRLRGNGTQRIRFRFAYAPVEEAR